jgi:hypothetical protein
MLNEIHCIEDIRKARIKCLRFTWSNVLHVGGMASVFGFAYAIAFAWRLLHFMFRTAFDVDTGVA